MSYDFPVKPHVSIKELIRCTLITVVIWWWSLTGLFPFFLALTLSQWLRNKFFAFVYNLFSTDMFPDMGKVRKMLFERLYEEVDPERPLKVLEVGVGSGANFEYYSENHRLTLLDSNPGFEDHIKESAKKYPKIIIDDIKIAKAENMNVILDQEYDVVVCTHLLCSVSDVKAVLNEIRRVLKPGGKFAFTDHVAFPKDHLAYWIQKAMTPIFKVYFDGCCLNRNIVQSVKEIHFSDFSYKVVYPTDLPTFVRPHVIGIATK